MADITPISPEEAAKLPIGGGAPVKPVITPITPEAAAKLKTPDTWKGIADGELRQGMGWLPWAAERGIEVAGGVGGAVGGAALGALPAIGEASTVVGIPAAAATEYAATRGGEAAGLTGADAINAKINEKFYGRKSDLGAKALGEDYLANLGGSVVGGAAPAVLNKVGRGLVGKGAIREAATGAAEDVAKNAGVAGPAEMETAAGGTKTAMADVHQAADAKVNQAVADAKGKLTAPEGKGSVVPDAREETMRAGIGRMEEATHRAMTLPPEPGQAIPGMGATARRTQFYDAVYGAKNRASEELGKRFDNVFAKHMDVPVPTAGLESTVQSELGYAASNNVEYSRATENLLREAQNIGEIPTAAGTGKLGLSKKMYEGMTPEQRASFAGKLQPANEPSAPPDTSIAYGSPTTAAVRPQPQGVASAVAPVRLLLGLRSKVGEAMAGASGPDRAALSSLRDQLDQSLSEANVPGAKQLRATYRGVKTDFGPDFYRTIGRVSDPAEAGDMLFTNRQRFLQMAEGSNAQEKAVLRDTFGDWVNSGNISKVNKDMAPALKRLGFSGPLADPEAWIYADKAVPKLAEMFESAPQARAKYVAAIQEATKDARGEQANGIVKDALAQAKTLGPTGQRIRLAIEAAKTPEEKAQAALKAFGALDPQAAGAELGQAQEAAGVKAIQDFKPGNQGFYGRIKNRAQIYMLLGGPMVIGGAMMGRPGMGATMIAGAGILGTGVGVREALSSAYRYSLRSPEAATAFYRAIANPGAPGSLKTITRMVVDASVADATAHAGKAIGGDPLEAKPPKPDKSAPMTSMLDQKRAEQIAGTMGTASPERVENIADLNKRVASGETPNIQNDLRDGRVSVAEVRKVLDGGNDIKSLFHGIPLDDAVDAFSKASPSERELALPVLAQKLNDEGKGLSAEQRTAMISRIKSALAQEGAVG